MTHTRTPSLQLHVESLSAPVLDGPARFALDPSLEALIEWSAAQRGIEPKIWLTLAVAAYHEAQTEP